MSDAHQEDPPRWTSGWEGHELDQLRRTARWPFEKKLLWLEEAHELALHFEEERRKRGERTIWG